MIVLYQTWPSIKIQEYYGAIWNMLISLLVINLPLSTRKSFKKQSAETFDNIHDEDIDAYRFAIVLIIMAFAIYVKYPRHSGNMNNGGNDYNLPYVKYPKYEQ